MPINTDPEHNERITVLFNGQEVEFSLKSLWSYLADGEDIQFEVTVRAPSDTTDAALIQFTRVLSDLLDDLHVSFGGKGLIVSKVEVFGNVGVLEGAGT